MKDLDFDDYEETEEIVDDKPSSEQVLPIRNSKLNRRRKLEELLEAKRLRMELEYFGDY